MVPESPGKSGKNSHGSSTYKTKFQETSGTLLCVLQPSVTIEWPGRSHYFPTVFITGITSVPLN